MKIVAIMGSPRSGGNTDCLADAALKEAAACGAETEKVFLAEYAIKPCVGHETCASYKFCLQQDDGNEILEKFRQADGVILATPVYFYNVSAQMKTFIDRNYFFYKKKKPYLAKAAGIIAVAEESGIEDTINTLKLFLGEVKVNEEDLFIVSGYASRIGDIHNNPQLIEDARNMGRWMAQRLKKD